MSGEPIFQARFQVSVPRTCSMEDLRRRIEQVAEDLIVEVRFREEHTGTSMNPGDLPRAHPHEETGSD